MSANHWMAHSNIVCRFVSHRAWFYLLRFKVLEDGTNRLVVVSETHNRTNYIYGTFDATNFVDFTNQVNRYPLKISTAILRHFVRLWRKSRSKWSHKPCGMGFSGLFLKDNEWMRNLFKKFKQCRQIGQPNTYWVLAGWKHAQLQSTTDDSVSKPAHNHHCRRRSTDTANWVPGWIQPTHWHFRNKCCRSRSIFRQKHSTHWSLWVGVLSFDFAEYYSVNKCLNRNIFHE